MKSFLKALILVTPLAVFLPGCATKYPDGSYYPTGNWMVIKINGHNYIEYSGMVSGIAHDPDCPCGAKE